MKKFTKKGISPLIATLILIVFSVGLGAVVMSWGETYIEGNAEFSTGEAEIMADCPHATIDIVAVKGVPQICYMGENIEILLENGPGGQVPIIQANVIGNEGVELNTNILESSLAKAEVRKTTFAHAPVGQVLQVKITPVLETREGKTFCTENALIIEDIPEC